MRRVLGSARQDAAVAGEHAGFILSRSHGTFLGQVEEAAARDWYHPQLEEVRAGEWGTSHCNPDPPLRLGQHNSRSFV